MYIKAGVVYKQHDGCYDGFVNSGTDVSATDPDVIATEVLVLTLVGLQDHWKVRIGYFFDQLNHCHQLMLSYIENHELSFLSWS